MPIPLQYFGDEQKCCFCFSLTATWTDIPNRADHKQVPCCENCGEFFFGIDVPSRRYWIATIENMRRESAKAFAAGRRSMVKPKSKPDPKAEAKVKPQRKSGTKAKKKTTKKKPSRKSSKGRKGPRATA